MLYSHLVEDDDFVENLIVILRNRNRDVENIFRLRFDGFVIVIRRHRHSARRYASHQ